jgi:hypothetical protein
MKLYATLETSKGKVVSVSDNEEIVATVYDGNMKAYSVIIRWTDLGDIALNEGDEKLPEFNKEMGAMITTREWRNEPNNRRKKQSKA